MFPRSQRKLWLFYAPGELARCDLLQNYYFHARSYDKLKDEKFSGGSPNIPEVWMFAEHLKILGSAKPQLQCTHITCGVGARHQLHTISKVKKTQT
jgi:hypothetical protein